MNERLAVQRDFYYGMNLRIFNRTKKDKWRNGKYFNGNACIKMKNPRFYPRVQHCFIWFSI